MTKLFIFDLDGVIADTLKLWDAYKPDIFADIFGKEIATQLNEMNWRGKHLNDIFHHATTLGYKGSVNDFQTDIQSRALKIYHQAEITPDIHSFWSFLKNHDFKIAIVSSSPNSFVSIIRKRLEDMGIFLDLVISVNDHPELKPKPHPDGYKYVITSQNSTPEHTYILEDSLPGLESAIASKANAIWFARYNANIPTVPTEIKGKAITLNEVIDILTLNKAV